MGFLGPARPLGQRILRTPALVPDLLAQRNPWDDAAEPGPDRALRVHNDKVIEADRRPGILARDLGLMLQKAREVVGLSYDEAAARLGREADWLARVETGFAAAGPEEVARILVEYGVREARSPTRSSTWPAWWSCSAALARRAHRPDERRQPGCPAGRGRGHARPGPRLRP